MPRKLPASRVAARLSLTKPHLRHPKPVVESEARFERSALLYEGGSEENEREWTRWERELAALDGE